MKSEENNEKRKNLIGFREEEKRRIFVEFSDSVKLAKPLERMSKKEIEEKKEGDS